jgi:hypothetical protein
MNNLEATKRLSSLAQLTRDVKAHQDAINGVIEGMRTAATNALSEAILCGNKLIAIKDLKPDGGWISWVEENEGKTGVSIRTAQRYMELARNTSRVSHLDSIRSALKFLQEENKESSNETGESKSFPVWMVVVNSVGRWKEKCLSSFGQIPSEGREKMREDLLPIASQLWPERFL